MFEEMWNFDKNQFILILFYLRRHRNYSNQKIKTSDTSNHNNSTVSNNCEKSKFIRGRGERKIFYQALIWMSFHHLLELELIIPYIPDCGYWKDLLILMGTPAENAIIKLFGTQLLKDYESFNQPIPGFISLAAKWTPNEKSSSDIKYGTNGKIAKFIGVSRKIFRIKYLVPLRKYLLVTEQLITDKKWNIINYNYVPRLSLKLHSNSFHKNDNTRFIEHLNKSHTDYIKQLILPSSYLTFNQDNLSLHDQSTVQDNPTLHDTLYISNLTIQSNPTIQDILPFQNQSTLQNNPTLQDISNISNLTIQNSPTIQNISPFKTGLKFQETSTIPNFNLLQTNTAKSNMLSIPNLQDILNNQNNLKIRDNIIFAIDISGAMTGFPITLAACLCCDSNIPYWIPFRFDNESGSSGSSESITKNLNYTPILISGDLYSEKIGSIINTKESGYNMEICLKIANDMNKSHIIFISNTLLDESELPQNLYEISEIENFTSNHKPIHITFWSITMNHPIIIDKQYMTIIEGYDINIYNELQQGHILTRDIYKDIIINILREENIAPMI
jgi:hypothetical protein